MYIFRYMVLICSGAESTGSGSTVHASGAHSQSDKDHVKLAQPIGVEDQSAGEDDQNEAVSSEEESSGSYEGICTVRRVCWCDSSESMHVYM